MGQPKGGKKLRRTAKHNKAAAKSRIARRKRDNPSPLRVQRDTTETGNTTS